MPDRSAPSVLVVDDDPGIRSMLQLAFTDHGYRVDAIGDAAEGWTGRPDAVVLDARLRGHSAAEFIAEARLDPDVPIILVSGAIDAKAVAAQIGAAAVVPKPFDLARLFDAVDAALATVREPAQPVRPEPG